MTMTVAPPVVQPSFGQTALIVGDDDGVTMPSFEKETRITLEYCLPTHVVWKITKVFTKITTDYQNGFNFHAMLI